MTVRDPGLQAERTVLAWSRTAMSILVNAVLALRAGVVQQQPTLVLLACALLLCAAATFAHGLLRRRTLLGAPGPTSVMESALTLVTLAALLACLTGLWSLSSFS
jgi:uncharacterized membrane protein YidH (DUF202 family)